MIENWGGCDGSVLFWYGWFGLVFLQKSQQIKSLVHPVHYPFSDICQTIMKKKLCNPQGR